MLAGETPLETAEAVAAGLEAVAEVTDTAAAEAVPVANTPAEADAALVLATVAVLLSAEDESELPEDDEESVQPVGGPKFGFNELSSLSTEDPGLGKTVSTPSVVAHPLETPSMFATNIEGKLVARILEIGALMLSRLEEPLETVTGAQFMYISRLPTLLNHVHARVYSPVAMPSGIENSNVAAPLPLGSASRLPLTFEGHPPSMLWITSNDESAVGSLSFVRLS